MFSISFTLLFVIVNPFFVKNKSPSLGKYYSKTHLNKTIDSLMALYSRILETILKALCVYGMITKMRIMVRRIFKKSLKLNIKYEQKMSLLQKVCLFVFDWMNGVKQNFLKNTFIDVNSQFPSASPFTTIVIFLGVCAETASAPWKCILNLSKVDCIQVFFICVYNSIKTSF